MVPIRPLLCVKCLLYCCSICNQPLTPVQVVDRISPIQRFVAYICRYRLSFPAFQLLMSLRAWCSWVVGAARTLAALHVGVALVRDQ